MVLPLRQDGQQCYEANREENLLLVIFLNESRYLQRANLKLEWILMDH